MNKKPIKNLKMEFSENPKNNQEDTATANKENFNSKNPGAESKNSYNDYNNSQSNKSFKRLPAVKVLISELFDGDYIKEEGWEPNYILTKTNKKISRANIIGTVISKETLPAYESIMLDDGTGSISIRDFEKDGKLSKLSVGNVVLLIGRPRIFGAELYVLPEIVKIQKDVAWIKYRMVELGFKKHSKKNNDLEESSETSVDIKSIEENVVENSKKQEQQKANAITDSEKIISIIRNLDKGEGAITEDVLGIYKKENGEIIISNLLETGEIFEFKPGKLKILE